VNKDASHYMKLYGGNEKGTLYSYFPSYIQLTIKYSHPKFIAQWYNYEIYSLQEFLFYCWKGYKRLGVWFTEVRSGTVKHYICSKVPTRLTMYIEGNIETLW